MMRALQAILGGGLDAEDPASLLAPDRAPGQPPMPMQRPAPPPISQGRGASPAQSARDAAAAQTAADLPEGVPGGAAATAMPEGVPPPTAWPGPRSGMPMMPMMPTRGGGAGGGGGGGGPMMAFQMTLPPPPPATGSSGNGGGQGQQRDQPPAPAPGDPGQPAGQPTDRAPAAQRMQMFPMQAMQMPPAMLARQGPMEGGGGAAGAGDGGDPDAQFMNGLVEWATANLSNTVRIITLGGGGGGAQLLPPLGATAGPAGLTEQQFAAVPRETWTDRVASAAEGADGGGGDCDCAICQTRYEVGDETRVLPCGHRFHNGCIQPWLRDRATTCPCCRQSALQSAPAAAVAQDTGTGAQATGSDGDGDGDGDALLRTLTVD